MRSTPRRLVCVALAAAAIPTAVASPATAALPTKGRDYLRRAHGDGMSVFFTVSRSGRTLRDIFMDFEMRCSNGRTGFSQFEELDAESSWRLHVARDGSFSGMAAAPQEDLDEFTASEEFWLSGTFIRRGKAARVVVRARKVGEGGTVCDTGDRHLTLKRRRPGPLADQ